MSFQAQIDNSKRIVPYTFKYKTEDNVKFDECIIGSLFKNSLFFLVPSLEASTKEPISEGLQSEDNTEEKGEQSVEKVLVKQNNTEIDSVSAQDLSKNEDFWFDVRIVIHSHKDFSIGQVSFAEDVASLAQEEFFPTPSKLDENVKYLPIIHITLDDCYLESLYSNKPLPKHISRSFQILDSSIWNKIVPLNEKKINNIKVGGSEGLYKTIQEIESNYERGLYCLEVAYEYANLNARLTKQAFLSGSHASGVSPFIFHSESALEHLIEDEFSFAENFNNTSRSTAERIINHKWRILLIDDKACTKLTPKIDRKVNKREDDLPWNCKLAIIKDNLKSYFKNYPDFYITHTPSDLEDENGILIEYVENIENAKKALKKKKYDFILIDYLLENNGNNEYGYELLEDIYIYQQVKKFLSHYNKENIIRYLEKGITNTMAEGIRRYAEKDELLKTLYERKKWEELYSKIEEKLKDKSEQYKIGPHNRFFFIFISAYSTAVYERLLAEGLNRSEKYWHIAVGACPTNTPQLFLYNLLKLMEKQLEDSGVDKLSPENIYDVVNKIYGETKAEEDNNTVRYRANKYYQDVLDLYYLYRKMLKDVQFPSGQETSIFNTTGSVLITNFISENVNLGGLLEHLIQLVHLTAFGTVRQWPEMWEEYIYFKAQFNLDNKNQEQKEKFNILCTAIEDHILELKSDVK